MTYLGKTRDNIEGKTREKKCRKPEDKYNGKTKDKQPW